jgi:glutathione S-transferase
MLELWQTEWCPASRRIRQRLTELGIDYLIRQVPVERADRDALSVATGADTIPTLSRERDEPLVGEETILRWLDRLPEPSEAEAHRLKAAKARRRYLEEECECPPTPTP